MNEEDQPLRKKNENEEANPFGLCADAKSSTGSNAGSNRTSSKMYSDAKLEKAKLHNQNVSKVVQSKKEE